MEHYYSTVFWLCKKLTGEKEVSIFTIPKALFKFLGYYWWDGGIMAPLPNFAKVWIYPVLYPSVQVIVSILTIKAVISMTAYNDYDFTRKINGYIVSMTFVASAFKSIYIRAIGENVKQLIEMTEEVGRVEVESGQIANVHKACAKYGFLLLSNAGTWAFYYIITHFDFPFPTAYPWDQENMLGWGLAFIISFLCAVYCAIVHTLVDIIFPICVAVITTHITTIRKSLMQLGSGKWYDEQVITQCVRLHVKLLRVHKQINECFGKLFVAQSVYTVLHACVLIFAVMKADEAAAPLMSALPMLSAAYAQLFMYCYYGQKLTTHHEALHFAAYNNSWYNCNIKLRKMLILFGKGLKRNIYLEGFGFVQASFPTYLKGLQESVSYFLVLKTVTSEVDT